MWTHNATWGLSKGASEEETTLLAAVGVVLGTLGVVTVGGNLLLLLSLLLHGPSRARCFHLHIANMAAAALLQGAGVLPLWAHYLIQGTWLHGDAVCGWWLAADTMATSVSALAIVVTACDRFIYLLCWRFVREGGKYVISFTLIFLSWLLALAMTLTLTLMRVEESGDLGGYTGAQVEGMCHWGPVKGARMAAARLVMYAVGAGLGTGLCLALVTLPCLGRGDLLPIDEDEAEEALRRRSELAEEEEEERRRRKRPSLSLHETALLRPVAAGPPLEVALEEDEEDENFPAFLMVKKSDRLEERDRWKWQVGALLAVAVTWAVLWLPSHLLVLADMLGGLGWPLPAAALPACVLLGYAHAALTPLLWLLHQPVRAALTALLLCRCCCKPLLHQGEGEEEEEGDSVEFRDVGPYRQSQVPAAAAPAAPPAAAPPAPPAAPPTPAAAAVSARC